MTGHSRSIRPRHALSAARVGSGAEHPRNQGHADEVRQACGLHLGHEVGAVDLDRPRADAEIEGDALVRVAELLPIRAKG